MIIDHMGIAVRNLSTSAAEYELLGFSRVSEIYEDYARNVNILFMENNQGYRIELIETKDIEKPSPIDTILKQAAHIIYHICYKTDSMDDTISELRKNGYIPVTNLEPAIAFNNKRVCFLLHKKIGFIELVEV